MEKIKFDAQKITTAEYCAIGFERDGNRIVSAHLAPKKYNGVDRLWLMPKDNSSPSYEITCGGYSVHNGKNGTEIDFDGQYSLKEHQNRPPCDFFGNFIKIEVDNGDFESAYAHFYWDNLIPEIAERTFMRKKRKIRDGYVLSTLNKKAYGGTYPAVDHEFHIKGRLAVGGAAETSLVKRMLQTQMKIMAEDKRKLSRNVCSIQPNGRREYNVWRKSKNLKVKAQMFRITANIEFIEEMYLYYCATKDLDFIKQNIAALEKNCGYIESFIDKNGLLNSHVYYEDQVIKDGYVLQAQCFAVNSFNLMVKLETLVGNKNKAAHYTKVAKILSQSVVKPYPNGYWDEANKRFIDWIDKKGKPHDHIHLLANRLPELFDICDKKTAKACQVEISKHNEVFKLFPSFVAAKIEDYDDYEIGTGGPYDLCAAGRYWCWDAAYFAFKRDGKTLLNQLNQVNNQAKLDNYLMGERYDMNYVYYNSGEDGKRNWHGANLYYEYPNVFIKVLINDFLGLSFGFDTDICLKPLFNNGNVRSDIYGIEYSVKDGMLTLLNISDKSLNVKVDFNGERTINLKKGESVTL